MVLARKEKAIHDGALKLRVARYGETCLIHLVGELDLANAESLERELDAALNDGAGQVVIDMGDLSFIDSTGIALLVTALSRGGEEGRVRFLRSRATAVTRVLQLTGVEERLPFVDGALDGSVQAV